MREFLIERSERTGDEICQEGRLLFGEGERVWLGGKVKDASSGAKVDSKSVRAVLMVDWREGWTCTLRLFLDFLGRGEEEPN